MIPLGRKIKQNKNSSPELLAQVNPENIELKKEFLSYLRSIGRSEGTISGYNNDLDGCFCWILQNAKNKAFKDLTKRDVINFQNYLLYENKNSPARIRRIKAAMSSLSNYIDNILVGEEPEYDDYRPIVRKIESPTLQPVQEKTVFSEEEIDSLLQKLTDMGEYEKACMLALAVYSGRRKAELLRFKMSDFGKDHVICDGALYESDKILTKGNKMLNCYTLKKKFDPYLNAWIKERKRLGIDSEWLFPKREDMSVARNTDTVNSWAATFSRLSGRDFYWHLCRHFYCTMCSKAGLPDGVIVEMVGWSDSSLLRKVYLDLTKEETLSGHFKDGDIYIPETTNIGDI